MEYTVQKLAQLSGISGRTLRYYDQINLLKPARINSSGYRIYGQKEVDQLQQILYFRELDVSLDEIRKIMSDPEYDQTEALQQHYEKLAQKRAQLDRLMETVEKTITSKKGGVPMQDKEKFEGFKEKLIEDNEQKYGTEIREKYGDAAIDASIAKMRGMTEAEFDRMKVLEKDILETLAQLTETGEPASEAAQELAAKHKEWLKYSWKTYSKEAHAGLAEMYVADERFAAYYDKAANGAAKFLRDAILIFTNTGKN
ncbi:MerR family transcriptional regulator [Virgibacillus kimchii]